MKNKEIKESMEAVADFIVNIKTVKGPAPKIKIIKLTPNGS